MDTASIKLVLARLTNVPDCNCKVCNPSQATGVKWTRKSSPRETGSRSPSPSPVPIENTTSSAQIAFSTPRKPQPLEDAVEQMKHVMLDFMNVSTEKATQYLREKSSALERNFIKMLGK